MLVATHGRSQRQQSTQWDDVLSLEAQRLAGLGAGETKLGDDDEELVKAAVVVEKSRDMHHQETARVPPVMATIATQTVEPCTEVEPCTVARPSMRYERTTPADQADDQPFCSAVPAAEQRRPAAAAPICRLC
ncbi:hypothetical protein Vretimale_14150 [Volvox reticuliferus]|nr:hypothetical protein Vretimale_14150 [Volvox reticuliferus]